MVYICILAIQQVHINIVCTCLSSVFVLSCVFAVHTAWDSNSHDACPLGHQQQGARDATAEHSDLHPTLYLQRAVYQHTQTHTQVFRV